MKISRAPSSSESQIFLSKQKTQDSKKPPTPFSPWNFLDMKKENSIQQNQLCSGLEDSIDSLLDLETYTQNLMRPGQASKAMLKIKATDDILSKQQQTSTTASKSRDGIQEYDLQKRIETMGCPPVSQEVDSSNGFYSQRGKMRSGGSSVSENNQRKKLKAIPISLKKSGVDVQGSPEKVTLVKDLLKENQQRVPMLMKSQDYLQNFLQGEKRRVPSKLNSFRNMVPDFRSRNGSKEKAIENVEKTLVSKESQSRIYEVPQRQMAGERNMKKSIVERIKLHSSDIMLNDPLPVVEVQDVEIMRYCQTKNVTPRGRMTAGVNRNARDEYWGEEMSPNKRALPKLCMQKMQFSVKKNDRGNHIFLTPRGSAPSVSNELNELFPKTSKAMKAGQNQFEGNSLAPTPAIGKLPWNKVEIGLIRSLSPVRDEPGQVNESNEKKNGKVVMLNENFILSSLKLTNKIWNQHKEQYPGMEEKQGREGRDVDIDGKTSHAKKLEARKLSKKETRSISYFRLWKNESAPVNEGDSTRPKVNTLQQFDAQKTSNVAFLPTMQKFTLTKTNQLKQKIENRTNLKKVRRTLPLEDLAA